MPWCVCIESNTSVRISRAQLAVSKPAPLGFSLPLDLCSLNQGLCGTALKGPRPQPSPAPFLLPSFAAQVLLTLHYPTPSAPTTPTPHHLIQPHYTLPHASLPYGSPPTLPHPESCSHDAAHWPYACCSFLWWNMQNDTKNDIHNASSIGWEHAITIFAA